MEKARKSRVIEHCQESIIPGIPMSGDEQVFAPGDSYDPPGQIKPHLAAALNSVHRLNQTYAGVAERQTHWI